MMNEYGFNRWALYFLILLVLIAVALEIYTIAKISINFSKNKKDESEKAEKQKEFKNLSAKEILNKKYAQGELSETEYLKKKKNLLDKKN